MVGYLFSDFMAYLHFVSVYVSDALLSWFLFLPINCVSKGRRIWGMKRKELM